MHKLEQISKVVGWKNQSDQQKDAQSVLSLVRNEDKMWSLAV